MKLSYLDKRNIKSILIFTAFTSSGAALNAIIRHGFDFYPVFSEFIIGFFFGLFTSSFEIYVIDKKLRRIHFFAAIIIRTFFYVTFCSLIITAIAASRIDYEDDGQYFNDYSFKSIYTYITSHEFKRLMVYCIALSLFANFIRQINSLLGQSVLWKYVRGKYQLPLEEELIFMFLDINDATVIAEKIGLIKNHAFLNDFFYDMTDSILECKGTIYQYVGDEIVLTWDLKDGSRNLNCVKCFFLISKIMRDKKDVYEKKYGVYPEFRAGLHFGKVITGVIGDIKREIVYHGDTINTTSRIQSECVFLNKKLLSSKDLVDKLNLEGNYKTESMGFIKLRGKEKELELVTIEETSD